MAIECAANIMGERGVAECVEKIMEDHDKASVHEVNEKPSSSRSIPFTADWILEQISKGNGSTGVHMGNDSRLAKETHIHSVLASMWAKERRAEVRRSMKLYLDDMESDSGKVAVQGKRQSSRRLQQESPIFISRVPRQQSSSLTLPIIASQRGQTLASLLASQRKQGPELTKDQTAPVSSKKQSAPSKHGSLLSKTRQKQKRSVASTKQNEMATKKLVKRKSKPAPTPRATSEATPRRSREQAKVTKQTRRKQSKRTRNSNTLLETIMEDTKQEIQVDVSVSEPEIHVEVAAPQIEVSVAPFSDASISWSIIGRQKSAKRNCDTSSGRKSFIETEKSVGETNSPTSSSSGSTSSESPSLSPPNSPTNVNKSHGAESVLNDELASPPPIETRNLARAASFGTETEATLATDKEGSKKIKKMSRPKEGQKYKKGKMKKLKSPKGKRTKAVKVVLDMMTSTLPLDDSIQSMMKSDDNDVDKTSILEAVQNLILDEAPRADNDDVLDIAQEEAVVGPMQDVTVAQDAEQSTSDHTIHHAVSSQDPLPEQRASINEGVLPDRTEDDGSDMELQFNSISVESELHDISGSPFGTEGNADASSDHVGYRSTRHDDGSAPTSVLSSSCDHHDARPDAFETEIECDDASDRRLPYPDGNDLVASDQSLGAADIVDAAVIPDQENHSMLVEDKSACLSQGFEHSDRDESEESADEGRGLSVVQGANEGIDMKGVQFLLSHLQVILQLDALMKMSSDSEHDVVGELPLREARIRARWQLINALGKDEDAEFARECFRFEHGLLEAEVDGLVGHLRHCTSTSSDARWDVIFEMIFPPEAPITVPEAVPTSSDEASDARSEQGGVLLSNNASNTLSEPKIKKNPSLDMHFSANNRDAFSEGIPDVMVADNDMGEAQSIRSGWDTVDSLLLDSDARFAFQIEYNLSDVETNAIMRHLHLCKSNNIEVQWERIDEILSAMRHRGQQEDEEDFEEIEDEDFEEIENEYYDEVEDEDFEDDEVSESGSEISDVSSVKHWDVESVAGESYFSVYPEFDDCASELTFINDDGSVVHGRRRSDDSVGSYSVYTYVLEAVTESNTEEIIDDPKRQRILQLPEQMQLSRTDSLFVNPSREDAFRIKRASSFNVAKKSSGLKGMFFTRTPLPAIQDMQESGQCGASSNSSASSSKHSEFDREYVEPISAGSAMKEPSRMLRKCQSSSAAIEHLAESLMRQRALF